MSHVLTAAQKVEALPRATIVVSSRGDASALARTLSSVAVSARHARADSEIIVISPAGRGPSAAALETLAANHGVRGLIAEHGDPAHARNAAIQMASGSLIVWTNDDALVEPGWLCAYIAAFNNAQGYALFAGRTVAESDPPAGRWMTMPSAAVARLLDRAGPGARSPITPDRLPSTLNFAVRADVQRRFLFPGREGRGRVGTGSSVEHEMISAALAANTKGAWVWDAVVQNTAPGKSCSRLVMQYITRFGRLASLPATELDLTRCLSADATDNADKYTTRGVSLPRRKRNRRRTDATPTSRRIARQRHVRAGRRV